MALYQKYRPKTLQELVGQEFVRQTLQAALKSDKVAHAYLFFGSRGTGKTSSARILAKALNCQNPRESGDPCNTCEFCLGADNGTFVDMIEIDGASNRKIEHARALIEKIYFAPTLGKRKVYIIDEVHMLTKEAFNALLKTIEEPPEHAFFLLATTELQKVPETIRSRCQTFTFHRLSPEQIAGRLNEIAQKEDVIVEHDALLLIAKKSLGGLRDAIGLFEQIAASGEVTVKQIQQELGMASLGDLDTFYEYIQKKDAEAAIRFVGNLSMEGIFLGDFVEQLLGHLRELMLEASLESEKHAMLGTILHHIDLFETARRTLRDAPIPTLPLEIAIVKATLLNSETVAASGKKDESWNIFGKKETKAEKLAPANTQTPSTETKAVQVEPEIQEEEVIPSASTAGTDLTSESLPVYWPKVLEQLKDPVLRIALQQVQSGTKEGKLILTFPAEVLRTQVAENKRMAELISAVHTTFFDGIEIKLETKSVILEPVENMSASDSALPDDKPVTDPNVISEIFGAKQNA